MKNTLFTICLLLCVEPIFAQGACKLDSQGTPFCAPPNGTAIETIKGIACAPGRCASDNQGYVKCSNTPGGGATIDNQGNVYCVGVCVNPSKDLCTEMKKVGK